MRLLDEFDTLVIVGGWNKNIFNPDWVSRYLFPNEKLEVEIPLNVDGSPRISSEKVRLAVLGNRLNFTSRKSDDTIYELIQTLGLKTADYLPHTPVTGFGMNFLFQTEINDYLSKIFQLNDNENLGKIGCKIDSTIIKRELELDKKLINLSISLKNDKLTFDFNFHFKILNLVEFKEKLSSNQIIDLKKVASNLLADVYSKDL